MNDDNNIDPKLRETLEEHCQWIDSLTSPPLSRREGRDCERCDLVTAECLSIRKMLFTAVGLIRDPERGGWRVARRLLANRRMAVHTRTPYIQKETLND